MCVLFKCCRTCFRVSALEKEEYKFTKKKSVYHGHVLVSLQLFIQLYDDIVLSFLYRWH